MKVDYRRERLYGRYAVYRLSQDRRPDVSSAVDSSDLLGIVSSEISTQRRDVFKFRSSSTFVE